MSYFIDRAELEHVTLHSKGRSYRIDPTSFSLRNEYDWVAVFKNLKGYQENIEVRVRPAFVEVESVKGVFSFKKQDKKRIIMFYVTMTSNGKHVGDNRLFIPTGELTRVFRFVDYVLGRRKKHAHIKINYLADTLSSFNDYHNRLKDFTIEETKGSNGELVSGYHGYDLIDSLIEKFKN